MKKNSKIKDFFLFCLGIFGPNLFAWLHTWLSPEKQGLAWTILIAAVIYFLWPNDK